MSTQQKAKELAQEFDATGDKSDYWTFDAANDQEKIAITMARASKTDKLVKGSLNDSYYVSSGPSGQPCACCGGSGRSSA